MIKRFITVILAAVLLVSLVACGDDAKKENASESSGFEKLKAEFQKKTADDLINECFADKANPTAQEFAKLYENYGFVNPQEDYEYGDNTIKEACTILKDSGARVASVCESEIITYILNSEYAGARAYMYREQAANYIDSSVSVYAPLLEKALSETEPLVVYSVLKGLPNSYGNNDAFWNFALPFADSEDVNLRKALAMAYCKIGIANKDAALETAKKLMNDSDVGVKQNALRYAGFIADDRIVDTYRAVLTDESQVKDYHENAFLGLMELWYGYPRHKTTSEAAYRLAIEYLTMDTTNPDIPSANGMAGLTKIGLPMDYDVWREAATYFDEGEIVAAMQKIIGDAEASKDVKSTAIDVVALWGTLEDVQAAKTAVEALPDDNKDKSTLISKCDSAIAKF